MQIYYQLKNSIIEKFINAQVKGTGKRAPRPGYYYIRKIIHETVKPLGQVEMAEVNWKAKAEDLFVEGAIFKIAITNLVSVNEEKTKDLKETDLISKTIFVFNPVFDVKVFNGEPRQVLKCQWHFEDEPAQFITAQNAALHAYFGNSSTTGTQAYENLIDTAPYDVLEALDWEAQYGRSNDGLIEESAYNNEDYTEEYGDNIVFDEPDDTPNPNDEGNSDAADIDEDK